MPSLIELVDKMVVSGFPTPNASLPPARAVPKSLLTRETFPSTSPAPCHHCPVPPAWMLAVTPPSLPGGGQFPIEFVIASTADADQILGFAQQIQQAAMKSGKFYFPPIIDTKIDQPQAEIVIDHDKVAALGLNL